MKYAKLEQEFTWIANAQLAENGVKVKVKINNSLASYTYLDSPTYGTIQIGMGVLPRENKLTPINRLRAQGLLFHEIGHLKYSQFEPMEIAQTKETQARENVNNILATKKEELKSMNILYVAALKEEIKNNIFYHELSSVLNMLEDAAVEVLMPQSAPYQKSRNKIFASISAIRDYIWSESDEPLLREECDESDIEKVYKKAIYEFHQIGVIGYRTNIDYVYLNKLFDPDEVSKLKDLALYSKFSTKSTKERYSIAKLVLQKFDKCLEAKADRFLSSLIEVLNMSDKDIQEAMDNMEQEDDDLAINMPNKTASGSTNQNSEYQYDLSDDQKDSLQEQEEKDEEELGDGDGQASEDSDSDKTNDSTEANDSTEKSDDSTSDSDDSSSSDSDSSQGQDSQENDSQDSESQDSQNEESEQNEGDRLESGENTSDEDNDSSECVQSKMPLPSMQELQRQIEKAVAQEVEQEQKNQSKDEGRRLENSIKEYKKRGDKSGCLTSTPTDFHKGIRTMYTKCNQLDPRYFSLSGKDIYRHREKLYPSIRQCATEINKIKMYAQKAKRQNAQRKGRLNTSGLYRIGIDQKVFQKTTPGKKQNFRIAFLIDQSGSMRGRKESMAIETAYVLASACRYADIPISVWGHNTSDDHVCLDQYLSFKEKNLKKLDTVFNICCGGANQDGLAIWHVAKDLVANKKSDEQLILFVLSDGEPAGFNHYFGRPAEEDITHILELFKKNYGVESFGITIETTRESVRSCQRIYKDHTIYVPDSKDLPKETIKLLKSLFK